MKPIKLPAGSYYTTKGAAIRLGYTDGRVRQLISSGEMRAFHLSERLYLITSEEVAKRLANLPTRGRPRTG